jgi:hypothetical protein
MRGDPSILRLPDFVHGRVRPESHRRERATRRGLDLSGPRPAPSDRGAAIPPHEPRPRDRATREPSHLPRRADPSRATRRARLEGPWSRRPSAPETRSVDRERGIPAALVDSGAWLSRSGDPIRLHGSAPHGSRTRSFRVRRPWTSTTTHRAKRRASAARARPEASTREYSIRESANSARRVSLFPSCCFVFRAAFLSRAQLRLRMFGVTLAASAAAVARPASPMRQCGVKSPLT